MNRATLLPLVGLALLTALPACQPQPAPGPTPPPPAISGLPLSIRLKQRSTSDIPESKGSLALTLGDITRDQVEATLIPAAGGAPILGPVSYRSGDHRTFEYQGTRYTLTLVELDNRMVGSDFATFRLSLPEGSPQTQTPPRQTPDPAQENRKIEALLNTIAGRRDTRFLRNGNEHTGEEAANHLRRKWKSADPPITTAREFVDKIASKSSTTGQDYIIRQSNGTTETALQALNHQLKKIESQPAP